MRTILTILTYALTLFSAGAYKYSYSFTNTPISEAIVKISKDHPDINISFIYKELGNYKTSAKINTDDAYEALRRVVGLNPVSVVHKDGDFYIEALQHGKFIYTGKAVGTDSEPVVAATVMLLAPKDSTVITYGITDNAGRFSIPCDRQGVIGKLSCLGYKTTYKKFDSFSQGTIIMPQHAVALGTVTVEGDNALLYSDKSVYIPSSKQKNAAQNAEDLIVRMAIPQLRIGSEVKTIAGQPVDIYIDYVPATSGELTGMRMDDVKRVEYYDYPADPRFQGKAHVINFIMQKYEYGGYVKGIYYDNFVTSRQLNGYGRLQYKKMTFDWTGGIFYYNDKKNYEDTYETFRLPQEDGTLKEFERSSVVDYSKKRWDSYWGSFKALYKTEKVTMSNMASIVYDRVPRHITEGKVTYTPQDYQASDYISNNSSRVNSLAYNGYWYFSLPSGNSITFNPHYAYTHTNQNSSYEEAGMETILNGAIDDSHQANGDLSFVHSFGKAGTFKAMCQGRFLQNRTRYSGTSDVADKATTFRLGPGLNYSYSGDKFYGNLGVGISWDKSEYGDIKENSTAPWINLSLQYAFSRKSSLSTDFSYGKSIPASSFRSATVIQAYPLMSYTGNPALVPFDSYQIEGSYSFIPNNNFSVSAFGFAWIVDNRYVYDYEASSTGILRTIKQPMGSYAQWQYGLQGSAKFFNKNLHLGMACYMEQAHNGAPYNWTKSKFITSLSAYYYLDRVYFGATYEGPFAYPDGCMVGTWMAPRDSYTFQVGWSDKHWNLRFFTRNFFRYNTYQTKGVMNSKYYDKVSYQYSGSHAGFFQISATYTFGFGKKINTDNEAYKASGAATGILK